MVVVEAEKVVVAVGVRLEVVVRWEAETTAVEDNSQKFSRRRLTLCILEVNCVLGWHLGLPRLHLLFHIHQIRPGPIMDNNQNNSLLY